MSRILLATKICNIGLTLILIIVLMFLLLSPKFEYNLSNLSVDNEYVVFSSHIKEYNTVSYLVNSHTTKDLVLSDENLLWNKSLLDDNSRWRLFDDNNSYLIGIDQGIRLNYEGTYYVDSNIGFLVDGEYSKLLGKGFCISELWENDEMKITYVIICK